MHSKIVKRFAAILETVYERKLLAPPTNQNQLELALILLGPSDTNPYLNTN